MQQSVNEETSKVWQIQHKRPTGRFLSVAGLGIMTFVLMRSHASLFLQHEDRDAISTTLSCCTVRTCPQICSSSRSMDLMPPSGNPTRLMWTKFGRKLSFRPGKDRRGSNLTSRSREGGLRSYFKSKFPFLGRMRPPKKRSTPPKFG